MLFARPLFLYSRFSSTIFSIFSACLYFYLKITQICIIFRCQKAIRNAQFIQHPLIVSLHYCPIKILLQLLHFSILTSFKSFTVSCYPASKSMNFFHHHPFPSLYLYIYLFFSIHLIVFFFSPPTFPLHMPSLSHFLIISWYYHVVYQPESKANSNSEKQGTE